EFVFDFFDNHNQISRHTVCSRSIVTFSRNFELHSVYDSGRDFNRYDFVFKNHSLAVCMSRFSVENLSGTPTDITRHRGLHLPKNRIGNAIYLSSTTTGRTSFIGYTCSFYFSFYFYFFLNSIGNIFQSKFYFDAKTASFGSTNTTTTSET